MSDDKYFGWKFQTRWFTDRERDELLKDNFAYYISTFLHDYANRELEIRNDSEIPSDGWDLSRVITRHRTCARDQLLSEIARQFLEPSDDEASEGFTNRVDDGDC